MGDCHPLAWQEGFPVDDASSAVEYKPNLLGGKNGEYMLSLDGGISNGEALALNIRVADETLAFRFDDENQSITFIASNPFDADGQCTKGLLLKIVVKNLQDIGGLTLFEHSVGLDANNLFGTNCESLTMYNFYWTEALERIARRLKDTVKHKGGNSKKAQRKGSKKIRDTVCVVIGDSSEP